MNTKVEWNGQIAKMFGVENLHSGFADRTRGIGFILTRQLGKQIISIWGFNERILLLKLKTESRDCYGIYPNICVYRQWRRRNVWIIESSVMTVTDENTENLKKHEYYCRRR